MSDIVNYNFGVDFNNDWSFNSDGDLNIVSYDDNIIQAVVNRLNTELDELFVFYEGYGSVLKSFLGWKATENTLSLMKLEIDTVLNQDPRLNDFETSVNYIGEGKVRINIIVYNYNEVDVEFNLVLDEFGNIYEED